MQRARLDGNLVDDKLRVSTDRHRDEVSSHCMVQSLDEAAVLTLLILRPTYAASWIKMTSPWDGLRTPPPAEGSWFSLHAPSKTS